MAIVGGDPIGPGKSTLQLSMPNGYRIPPHFHPSYEHVEVKEGTAPFLDRQGSHCAIGNIHGPLHDYLRAR
jgi:hypothetical protein